MKDKICLDCKVEIFGHQNRKRCPACVEKLRKRPGWKLNQKQISIIKKNAGLISREEIAMMANTSVSTVKRWARDHKVSLAYFNYKEDVIKNVCSYYEIHGKRKTQEMFTDLNVRSIVERHKIFKPRQSKWKDNEIIDAVRMSCFVSFKDQARKFNRPFAFSGSLISLWQKKLNGTPTRIHGLSQNKACLFVTKNCPWIKAPLIVNIDGDESCARNIFLWVDMEKHFLEDCPELIKEAIRAMAEFQRWIFQGKDPKKEIQRMIDGN